MQYVREPLLRNEFQLAMWSMGKEDRLHPAQPHLMPPGGRRSRTRLPRRAPARSHFGYQSYRAIKGILAARTELDGLTEPAEPQAPAHLRGPQSFDTDTTGSPHDFAALRWLHAAEIGHHLRTRRRREIPYGTRTWARRPALERSDELGCALGRDVQPRLGAKHQETPFFR